MLNSCPCSPIRHWMLDNFPVEKSSEAADIWFARQNTKNGTGKTCKQRGSFKENRSNQ